MKVVKIERNKGDMDDPQYLGLSKCVDDGSTSKTEKNRGRKEKTRVLFTEMWFVMSVHDQGRDIKQTFWDIEVWGRGEKLDWIYTFWGKNSELMIFNNHGLE